MIGRTIRGWSLLTGGPGPRSGTSPTKLHDTFSGTDGTSISGRTPDTVSIGNTWSLIAGTINVETGGYVMGEATTGTPDNTAVIDVGVDDAYTITATVNLATANAVGIWVRWADAGNSAILCNFEEAGGIRIYSYNGASFTSRATAGTPSTFNASTDYVVTVTVNGTTVDATYSTTTASWTAATDNGATKVGTRLGGNVGNKLGEIKLDVN